MIPNVGESILDGRSPSTPDNTTNDYSEPITNKSAKIVFFEQKRTSVVMAGEN